MMFKENCEVGDIVLVKTGNDDRLIAHTECGKVIIPINIVKCGYAKISEVVKIAEKYILVKMENVVKDYYDSISYEEFKEALKINGYKIGFDRPFETKPEDDIEHQILAYNLDNGVVVVAETYFSGETFNTIDVYCPNVNGLHRNIYMESRASSTMTVLDLCHEKNFEFPLQWINGLVENKYWDSRDYINLWTYADSDDDNRFKANNKYGFEATSLWVDTINRILLADKEIENILGNSARLIPVFKSRKNGKIGLSA